MKLIGTILAMAFVLLVSGMAHAAPTAGVFRLPFNPTQPWNACNLTGYWDSPSSQDHGQIFMEWNAALGKYHRAEDWNGKCGDDKYAPLYASADGMVTKVQNDVTVSPTIGKMLMIQYLLPDGSKIDSVHDHVHNIYVVEGQNVFKDQQVATIGDANGLYSPHLHWEMRSKNVSLAWNADPYITPLTTQTALLYSSPSLFIDDRSNAVVQNLPQGQWTNFYQTANAPGSTAYVEVNGLRLSLQRATTLGFIYQYVYFQKNGSWYYYPDISQVFFEAGNTYWVYAFTGGARLNILVPGHQYKDDRAKIDMIRSVNGNSNFARVYTQYVSTWSDGSFDYWMMVFSNDTDSALRYSYVEQATLKSNPLVRYTTYLDPATGSWTSWVQVNPNTLD